MQIPLRVGVMSILEMRKSRLLANMSFASIYYFEYLIYFRMECDYFCSIALL
jgi:hypothetical protein